MNRRHSLIALATLALAAAQPAQALRYEDQEFSDQITLDGAKLQLNGVGKRAVLTFRGYVAGLYMAHKATTPEAVYAVPGAKRVELRILMGVGTEEFVKAVNKGVGRNCTEEEKAALGDRVALLNKNFQLVAKVAKGDLITVDYLPRQGGTVLTINGKVWGQAVPGEDLYTAFLKVFLGQRVSDEKLKAGLLGRPST